MNCKPEKVFIPISEDECVKTGFYFIATASATVTNEETILERVKVRLEEMKNVYVMSEEELKIICRDFYLKSMTGHHKLQPLFEKQFEDKWKNFTHEKI